MKGRNPLNAKFVRNICYLKEYVTSIHERKKTLCEFCKANFTKENNLNKHILSVHEGKKSLNNINRQIENIHEEKRISICNVYKNVDLCGKSALNDHLVMNIKLICSI